MVGSKGGFHGSMSCLMQDDKPWVRRERRRACCSKYCRFFFQFNCPVFIGVLFQGWDGRQELRSERQQHGKEQGVWKRDTNMFFFLLYGYWGGRSLMAELFEYLTLTFYGG
ncbi:hypothetical protein VTJ04DRAFT_10007 [Mycothermus thermophilus]|uniref:uncharacterized protein n=1 Tax=Humicola insolens TaxID=85995 RepID=UPI003742817E